MYNWYVVQTKNLKEFVASKNLTNQKFEVYLPIFDKTVPCFSTFFLLSYSGEYCWQVSECFLSPSTSLPLGNHQTLLIAPESSSGPQDMVTCTCTPATEANRVLQIPQLLPDYQEHE